MTYKSIDPAGGKKTVGVEINAADRATSEPMIAIVGRPNVGKSTLFNRLLRKRRAITHAQPGVTRDVVGAAWSTGGINVRLFDTGGVSPEGDGFHSIVSERSLAALKTADIVLLVMDVTEITSEDELFLEAMAPYRDRTILVVNKVDTERREPDAWNYHRFGFSPVVVVSAEHGRGIDELLEAVEERLRPLAPVTTPVVDEPTVLDGADGQEESGAESESDSDTATDSKTKPRKPALSGDKVMVRLAVLGQPNTGKSTLCNALIGHEASIVSDIPGTTRDVLEENFQSGRYDIRILDTAGIRRKRTVTDDVEYYSVTRAIDTIRESDVVLLMVDAEKGLSEQDKKIASLVVKEGRGVVLALNKWDLLAETKNQFEAVRDRIRFVFPILEFAPVVPISAKDKTGLERLLQTTISVHRQLNLRVDTGPLNAALARWVTRTPPPMPRGGQWKLRYMTHVQVNPSVFVLFVNRSSGFPDTYLSYIRNQVRKEFGLTDIPLRIEVRYSQKG